MDWLDSRSLQATWGTLPETSLRDLESCCLGQFSAASEPAPVPCEGLRPVVSPGTAVL